MHTVAIVVARGGSRRLPGKALLPFGDSTLIGHKIDTLAQCRAIDEIVVGSDSDEILSEAVAHGASIRKRDAYHCDEARCTANEMIRNMAAMVEADVVVWAHPTNPLVTAETYDAAVRAFRDATGEGRFDSLASVTDEHRHAWHDGKPLNFNPRTPRHQPAAELPPVRHQNGAIFIQPHRRMFETAYFYGDKPLLFPMSLFEGWDIDEREDYDAARALYAAQRQAVPA